MECVEETTTSEDGTDKRNDGYNHAQKNKKRKKAGADKTRMKRWSVKIAP